MIIHIRYIFKDGILYGKTFIIWKVMNVPSTIHRSSRILKASDAFGVPKIENDGLCSDSNTLLFP